MKNVLGLMTILLIIGSLAQVDSNVVNAENEFLISAPTKVNSKRLNTSEIQLRWSKVEDADGYIIYRWNKKKTKYSKVKVVKNKKNVWTDKKLNPNTVYTYRIKAYKKNGDSKIYSQYSYKVSTLTWEKKSKKSNVKSIKTSKSSMVLEIDKTSKIKTIIKSSNKKNKAKTHNKKLTWSSSNKEVATVSKTGTITAVNPGKCNIYVRAHNGIKSKVKVEVILSSEATRIERTKFAYPNQFKFLDSVDENSMPNPVKELIQYQDSIKEIAKYFAETTAGDVYWCFLEDDGKLLTLDKNGNKTSLNNSHIESLLFDVLSNSDFFYMEVSPTYNISFSYNNSAKNRWDNITFYLTDVSDYIETTKFPVSTYQAGDYYSYELAPRWYYEILSVY